MRHATLLGLALVALPALAFDETQVLRPDALAGVQAVYVAPVALDLPAPASRFERQRGEGERAILPRDAQAKADDLAAALRRGLDREFSIADAPDPGVLVVEPTLTRLASSRPTMADYRETPGLGFESAYAGGAAVSLRLVRDGQEVAVLKDRYVGTFSDGTPRVGIWQDADRAFSSWSRQLPTFIGEPKTASR